ncbi:hypothetical protein DES39_1036 [Orbus hercynius]|uniref:Uncharacterized protein n=1 Tax=Orbus hercynius TaxID=593135 RepID=A0A495RJS2_9GAMM|nr:hypothetical protein DES39_1036 [Orbus hercynius]
MNNLTFAGSAILVFWSSFLVRVTLHIDTILLLFTMRLYFTNKASL